MQNACRHCTEINKGWPQRGQKQSNGQELAFDPLRGVPERLKTKEGRAQESGAFDLLWGVPERPKTKEGRAQESGAFDPPWGVPRWPKEKRYIHVNIVTTTNYLIY